MAKFYKEKVNRSAVCNFYKMSLMGQLRLFLLLWSNVILTNILAWDTEVLLTNSIITNSILAWDIEVQPIP